MAARPSATEKRGEVKLIVPDPTETKTAVMSDGAQILLRRHGNRDGERLVLSHGNGLAIDAYLPFWSLLCVSYDLVLFDVRNHGRNPVHDADGHTWDRIGQDMEELQAAITEHFGKKPAVGVFHSLSSVAAVRQVLKGGGGWSKLVLFDPPFYPRKGHALIPLHEEHLGRMERLARRRPESYSDPSEFSAVLASRAQFSRWVDGVHDLFARTTLRQSTPGGDWELACPRDYEADIFLTNRDGSVWPRMSQGVDVPLAVIGADPGLPDADSPSQVCRAMAEELDLTYEWVPDTTHMLQLEDPQGCVAALQRALQPRADVAQIPKILNK